MAPPVQGQRARGSGRQPTVHAKTCIMGIGIHPDGILLPIPTGPRALWWDDPQSRTRTQTCWGGGCGEEDCSGWTTATRRVFLQQTAGLCVPRLGTRLWAAGEPSYGQQCRQVPAPSSSLSSTSESLQPHVISLSALNAWRDSCFLHSSLTGTLGLCHSGTLHP